jgi:hypothetical protein
MLPFGEGIGKTWQATDRSSLTNLNFRNAHRGPGRRPAIWRLESASRDSHRRVREPRARGNLSVPFRYRRGLRPQHWPPEAPSMPGPQRRR